MLPQHPVTDQRTREIFTEYAAQLGIYLCFQNFDNELADLPGDYAGPEGALVLVVADGHFAGCCALRPLLAALCRPCQLS